MYYTSIEDLFQSKDILKTLDRISDNELRSICLIPFGSVNNMFVRLPAKVFPHKNLKVVKTKKTTVLYELEIYSRHNGELIASEKFLVYKLPLLEFTYLLIYLGHTDFFHSYLKSFVEQYKSEIVQSFIKSNELIKLIENYQSKNSLDQIVITRATQKIRYQNENRITAATWNNSSIEDAYTWLQENDGFFRSIQFKAIRIDKEITNSYIDRHGTMRVNKHFSKLYQSLATPVLQSLETHIKLFNKRGRSDNKHLEVRPLEVNFGKEVFKLKENHKIFIDAVSQLSDASISVMHGNPYIHLSLLDYIDGSTYDLWVLDSQQLIIIPQMRSSIISLQRIVNHIFDYYAEGEIKDYEQ